MNKKLMLCVLAAPFMLIACSSKDAPDEFMVLKNPPLVLPPDYHLVPPGEKGDPKGAFTPQEIARRALFGDA